MFIRQKCCTRKKMSGGFKRNVTLIVKLSRRSLQHSDFYVCSFPTARVPIHKKKYSRMDEVIKSSQGIWHGPTNGNRDRALGRHLLVGMQPGQERGLGLTLSTSRGKRPFLLSVGRSCCDRKENLSDLARQTGGCILTKEKEGEREVKSEQVLCR